jgi:NAD(P)-dependent dehydrogenase (short-subunit alcohol dehydrogenase family)
MVHTGCSTGFGREHAKAVLKRGWNAAVTARDPAAIADIVADHPERALSAALDVTDKSQISSGERRFGRIDVLVNNVGYGYRSALEESDEEEIHRLVDTNVFGLIEVTRAILPLMRRSAVDTSSISLPLPGGWPIPALPSTQPPNSRLTGFRKVLPRRCGRSGSGSRLSSRPRSAPILPAVQSTTRRGRWRTMPRPPVSSAPRQAGRRS